MAIYIGSPYGILIGKLGPTVAYYSHGKKIVRAYRKPLNKGSRQFIEKVIQGHAKKEKVNIRQANAIRTFGFLIHLAQKGRYQFIIPCWENIVKKMNYKLTSFDLFLRDNQTIFYKSIPKPYEFLNYNNLPDLKTIQLTTGILEPTQIKEATYDGEKIRVKWSRITYRNGTQEDKAYLFIIHWAIQPNNNWFGCLEPWKYLKLWSNITPGVAKLVSHLTTRKSQEEIIEIGKIENGKLFAFLSFFNKKIGFSPTTSTKVKKME